MLLLIKMLRKLGKSIRGGVTTRQMVLSCLLGGWIGLTPGFDALSVLLILLVAVLNVNLFLIIGSAAIGKAVCYSLVPILFRIGYHTIHSIGLEGMFAAAGDMPIVALLNLQDYCKLGGLIVGIPLALCLAWPLACAVRALRLAISTATGDGERFGKLSQSRWMRTAMWVLFGKNRKTAEEALAAKSPVLRRAGWLLIILVVAAGLFLHALLADELVRVNMERSLGEINTAEVNVQAVDVSLFSGKVSILGLQMTDFERPTHNLFQAERLELNLSVSALLAGRIVISDLISEGARSGAERATPGWAHPAPDMTDEERNEGQDLGVRIVDYLSDEENVRRIEKYVRKGAKWLEARRKEQEREASEEPDDEQMEDMLGGRYLDLLKRSARQLLSDHPLVTVQNLRISELRRAEDSSVYSIIGTNLSTHPGRSDQPMDIRVEGSNGIKAAIILHFEEVGRAHELTVSVPDLPIPTDRLGEKSPVMVTEGRFGIALLEGRLLRDGNIELPVAITVQGLQMTPRPGNSFGPMAQVFCDNFHEGKLTLTLRGRPWLPRVTADMGELLAGLETTGTGLLKGLIEGELKKLRDKLPGLPKLPDLLPKLPDLMPKLPDLPKLPGLPDAPKLPGLFDRKKDDEK
jgi:uncharacterized protein (TIGR03546 family)